MSADRRSPTGDERPGVWPAQVRYPVIAVLAGVGLIAAITVVYDAGWLPLAGPFVAVVVAAVIVFVVMWWRGRRLRRLATTAARQLEELGPAIAHERGLPPSARPTAASDASLERAAEQTDAALQQLAWGHEQGAVPFVTDLADRARGTWRAEAPLTRQVADLAGTTTEIDRVVRRMLDAAARRRPRS